ncbi:hypothetical protein MtrunA17_Chr5g0406861 [Medicago truncatula]|uniref:Uncharacterized protein n=1 Tax=Medicago truncatula TaxID=3880 RepID=A0A396HPL3_MEDTR|nr:hypothetical protein MtrunA17_Chr5g0406861 [Medicago truncatula]
MSCARVRSTASPYVLIIFVSVNIKQKIESLIIPSSTDKNVEIVKPDVLIGVQTLVPPLCVCELMMTLPFLLCTKKQAKDWDIVICLAINI